MKRMDYFRILNLAPTLFAASVCFAGFGCGNPENRFDRLVEAGRVRVVEYSYEIPNDGWCVEMSRHGSCGRGQPTPEALAPLPDGFHVFESRGEAYEALLDGSLQRSEELERWLENLKPEDFGKSDT